MPSQTVTFLKRYDVIGFLLSMRLAPGWLPPRLFATIKRQTGAAHWQVGCSSDFRSRGANRGWQSLLRCGIAAAVLRQSGLNRRRPAGGGLTTEAGRLFFGQIIRNLAGSHGDAFSWFNLAEDRRPQHHPGAGRPLLRAARLVQLLPLQDDRRVLRDHAGAGRHRLGDQGRADRPGSRRSTPSARSRRIQGVDVATQVAGVVQSIDFTANDSVEAGRAASCRSTMRSSAPT